MISRFFTLLIIFYIDERYISTKSNLMGETKLLTKSPTSMNQYFLYDKI